MKSPSSTPPLLEVRDLSVEFPVRGGPLRRTIGAVQAVRRVSLALSQGETLALVGESGCGKSTLAKSIMRFHTPTSGSIQLHGQDIANARGQELRHLRSGMQFVFQDPYSSLTPHRTIGRLIEEPLRIHGIGSKQQRTERVEELLRLVGLNPDQRSRYPHEFSGGQRQRVGIARALSLEPELLILDEPVSALDVSIQAQVINLLRDLQDRLGLTYLFIAHDLTVVRNLSHRVAVMYLGQIVEEGPTELVLTKPTHPYTQALLSAIPVADPHAPGFRERRILSGEVPNATNPPSGCGFRTRCWKAEARCAAEVPELKVRSLGRAPAACHFPADIEVALQSDGSDATP